MDEEKLDPTFKVVSNLQTAEPARKIMNEIFNKHDIFDEEFIRHFQSINFNSRLLELYLVALFDSSGFTVENSPKERPSFKIGHRHSNTK